MWQRDNRDLTTEVPMKLSDIRAGDGVFTDSSFTCIKPGLHLVEESDLGLYVCCDHGEHYLDGQQNEDGELVGLTSGPDIRSTHELRLDYPDGRIPRC